MEAKHTPGPWIATGWKNTVVNAPNGATLCLCPSDEPNCPIERIQANAALIARAPDLLAENAALKARCEALAEALRECVTSDYSMSLRIAGGGGVIRRRIEAINETARAALAKATA